MIDRDVLVDALHEQIDGDFLVAASRWTPDENVAISKASVTEVVHWAADAVAPLLAAARVEALREAADRWQKGEWANTPRHTDRVADRIGMAQYVGDWLRERADRIEANR